MKSDGYQSYLSNKRKTVFKELDKNPLLTASKIVKILEIPIDQAKHEMAYLKKLKYDWKRHHEIERGLIRSCPDEVHNAFYRGVLPLGVVRDARSKSLPFGWVVSRSKNRFLLFKDVLGRIRLFETGTVEMFVRKPANDGKAMQLFCNGFTKTRLIDSISVVEEFQKTLMRRMHATFDFGQRLPYGKITAFQDTHKFVAVLGDRTHPTCAEFMFEYHQEVQNARALFDQLADFFNQSGNARSKQLDQDYSR